MRDREHSSHCDLCRRDKTVVLGLVSSKIAGTGERATLLQRIEEAAKFVPLENLALSPQCGFASTMEGNLLTEDDPVGEIATGGGHGAARLELNRSQDVRSMRADARSALFAAPFRFGHSHLGENFVSGHVEGGIRGRHSAVDRGLQQHFFDFVAGDAVIDRRAHVHAKFIVAIERDHHRESDQAARLSRQGRAASRFLPRHSA